MSKRTLNHHVRKLAWFSAVLVALVVLVWFVSAKSPLRIAVEKSPDVSEAGFKSAKLVEAVIALRHAGKEKALEELRGYAEGRGRDANERVALIAICLFPNQGLKVSLGASNPSSLTEEAMAKPTFPLVFSRGVPFLIVEGYALGGMLRPANQIVDDCKGLVMVDVDLPVSGYPEAAQALVSSEEFKAMFLEESDAKRVGAYVLGQAR